MDKIKIFVTHTPNRNTKCIKDNPLFYNVIAGSDYQVQEMPEGMYADNTGENISSKNKSYCELTTQYWAWKNLEADYYGFFHYRRYFSFNEQRELPETRWETIEYDYLNEKEKKELCLNRHDMENMIRKYDFIIAKPVDVTKINAKSVYDHYNRAEELHVKDIDLLLDILRDKHSYLYDIAQEFFSGKWFYPCNMFIMQKELFNDYSALLFDVLAEFDRRSNMKYYSREALRTPGHLGERLAGIYYLYLQKQKKYRLTTAQVALIHNAEADDEVVLPSKDVLAEEVPIVLAADQNYVPILYACVQSIVENTSKARQYRIFIFHKNIDQESQKLFLERLESESQNIHIHFINVSRRVRDYILKAKEHITTETFYRFLILDILKQYQKVVYLDSDLIVCRDIAELYDLDIGDNLIAGTKDPDFAGQCNKKHSEMRRYCQSVLGMKNPFLYFQAGVLVFNVQGLNRITSVAKLFEMADTGIYRFSDQDILNIVCKGRVKYLDMAWNMVFDCDHKRWHSVIKYAPGYLMDEYEEARKHPYIIHYAGFLKPWMRPGEDFGYVFWEVARRTPYYEEILAMPRVARSIDIEQRAVKLKRARQALMKVLKPGSKTRMVLGKVYWKVLGER